MRSQNRRPGTLKLGSAIFLVLALALAMASGDVLLVLAVASAIAGILLLTMRRGTEPARRPAAVPVQDRPLAAERVAAPARPQRASGRMAVRRHRSASLFRRRVTTSARRAYGAGAADPNVAEAPSQAQVIQVLQ
ncbi:MAG TPA: hypothetical protein VHB98_00140 [Chloroflexota bacterium]|nr:hypothetical protein [Chloroflexota bacterium]